MDALDEAYNTATFDKILEVGGLPGEADTHTDHHCWIARRVGPADKDVWRALPSFILVHVAPFWAIHGPQTPEMMHFIDQDR